MPPADLITDQPEPLDVNAHIRRLGKPQVLVIPQMVNFHTWLDGKRLARRSCRVVGDSRTGKTVNCDTYHLKHKVTQSPGQPPTIPVVYWKCPENLSVSALFIGLLHLLQYRATQGTIPDLRERLYHVLESCQVEMVIFDEAQRVSPKAMSEIRDISDLDIAVVVVGTDRLNAVLGKDEQVQNRFLSSYRFTRLTVEEMREMTALWEEHILKLPEPSKLTNAKAQNLLFQATRGYIGLLDLILTDAAILALQLGQSHITIDILKQAILQCS